MASYFIRQGGFAPQGPFDEARVRGYISAGKVRAGAGMEISADGQRWMPVEEHRLFASAAPPVQPIPGPPPVRAVEPVEEVEEISAAPAARPERRPARRPRRAPASGGGGKAALAVVGILVVGGIAVMASKGGSKDADPSGHLPSRSVASAPPVVEPPRPPQPARETKEAFRARWEKVHEVGVADGKVFTPVKGIIWLMDAAEVKTKIESVSGRKPDRTQTIGGKNYWYFDCADGMVQFVWWQDLAIHYYRVNDY